MEEIRGLTASPGTAAGRACLKKESFRQGDILVVEQTTASDTILVSRAAGVITQRGGLLSHAAIVSRELGKPCIVGVKNALKLIKHGQIITIIAQEKEGKIITGQPKRNYKN